MIVLSANNIRKKDLVIFGYLLKKKWPLVLVLVSLSANIFSPPCIYYIKVYIYNGLGPSRTSYHLNH